MIEIRTSLWDIEPGAFNCHFPSASSSQALPLITQVRGRDDVTEEENDFATAERR
jgi:hypothetical protein